jgi:hypothetical protein
LNLPLYVLGGGVTAAWKLFAPKMFAELSQGSYIYRLTDPQHTASKYMAKATTWVMPARLGSNSGILGACLVPFGADPASSDARVSTPDQSRFVGCSRNLADEFPSRKHEKSSWIIVLNQLLLFGRMVAISFRAIV